MDGINESCGKQIAIPLAQWVTLRCPPLPEQLFEERTPSAVITVPRDSPFNISLYHTAQLPLMLTRKAKSAQITQLISFTDLLPAVLCSHAAVIHRGQASRSSEKHGQASRD